MTRGFEPRRGDPADCWRRRSAAGSMSECWPRASLVPCARSALGRSCSWSTRPAPRPCSLKNARTRSPMPPSDRRRRPPRSSLDASWCAEPRSPAAAVSWRAARSASTHGRVPLWSRAAARAQRASGCAGAGLDLGRRPLPADPGGSPGPGEHRRRRDARNCRHAELHGTAEAAAREAAAGARLRSRAALGARLRRPSAPRLGGRVAHTQGHPRGAHRDRAAARTARHRRPGERGARGRRRPHRQRVHRLAPARRGDSRPGHPRRPRPRARRAWPQAGHRQRPTRAHG